MCIRDSFNTILDVSPAHRTQRMHRRNRGQDDTCEVLALARARKELEIALDPDNIVNKRARDTAGRICHFYARRCRASYSSTTAHVFAPHLS
eukprot:2297263-Rhodomonas_salina.1